jgi:uncharacterized protein (TIGR02679 family)
MGLGAYTGGEEDAACAHYRGRGEAHVLTLENISRFTRVEAKGNKVFILENAVVFALLCERLRGTGCTLVCAANGMNAALDALLTLCCDGGAVLHYSGNMDLKGLGLGDNLYLRFGGQFIPWRYGKGDYELAQAESETTLTDDKRDLSLHNEAFASLLSLIRKKGKTATHLPLVELLAGDVRAHAGGK